MSHRDKPLAAYVRVSHVGGRKGDRFHSPDQQQREIAAWAKAHGHEVVMLDPELDRKGSDASRPILRQAVDGVKAGRYSGVVVAYLSRAGRDLRLMLDMWDEVEREGGAVYSARENIDGSTPAGRLHRNLLAAIAQHELEDRREGFEHARRSATERGIWQRRQTPLGYDRDPDTRRLVPNDDARTVLDLFAGRVAGTPMVQLARRVGMTASGVRQLLRNRVYLGELRVGEHVNANAHPPIVDRDMFLAVQQTDVVRGPRSTAEHPALLAGLVRCAGCGHVMSRQRTARVVYSCHVNHSAGVCPEPASITARLLDEHVTLAALAYARRRHSSTEASAHQAVASDLRRDIDDAEAEFRAYLAGVQAAGLQPEHWAEGARARREAADRATDALAEHLATQIDDDIVTDPVEAWARFDEGQRGRFLRRLIEAVVVHRVGRGRVVPVAQRTQIVRHGAHLVRGDSAGERAVPVAPLIIEPGNEHVLRVELSE